MHSTWMDPLIKAQNAARRSRAARTALPGETQPPRVRQATRGLDGEAVTYETSGSRAWEWRSPDRAVVADWEPDSADILPDMEREFGIAEWIDPETGAPAEGQSRPHIERE